MKNTKIKICGVVDVRTAVSAERLGADAIGLVFCKKSKRCISVEEAKEVIHSLQPFTSIVALFSNDEEDYVQNILSELKVNLIQFHGDENDEAFLLGVLSSIPLDWYARRNVELHLNHYVVNDFPIPRPNKHNPLRQKVINLSGRLASPDERFADWAKAVGVEYGPLGPNEKEDMIQELDAAVAHLYGLSESQLRHIFETFRAGGDYQEGLEATLKHYKELEKEL